MSLFIAKRQEWVFVFLFFQTLDNRPFRFSSIAKVVCNFGVVEVVVVVVVE